MLHQTQSHSHSLAVHSILPSFIPLYAKWGFVFVYAVTFRKGVAKPLTRVLEGCGVTRDTSRHCNNSS